MQKPFFVWQNKVLRKINPEDVMCLSTEGNYTRIYVAGKTHYMNLIKPIETQYPLN
jgi:hypothetical protein